MHGTSPARLIRAGVFAAVSVGVSANGHALQSGHDVPPAGMLLGSALMLAAGWGLAGRERGGGAVLGWMLWGQLALHFVFALTESGAAHPGHPAAAPAAAAGQDLSPGMLAAHLVAALVCALWLRRGEAAAFRLARGLRTLLADAFRPPAAPPALPLPAGPERLGGGDEPSPAADAVLRYAVIRRGPPTPRIA
ncbi:hypothetical protein [Thermobifida cellulosilytica]|uniref:Uncharacterized protein n=1 Tax=Thermobifida cellulosilytica TB100 TaxID=665004 RepID=A0A147KIN2_THECS|nr:hypothetical protein [Thermobifida cellulosilytica]KUP97140.1 hypothetical protein AC529_08490 [Thermobifida cellulosilytica TB100]